MGVWYSHKPDEGEPVGTNLTVVFTSCVVKLFFQLLTETYRRLSAASARAKFLWSHDLTSF